MNPQLTRIRKIHTNSGKTRNNKFDQSGHGNSSGESAGLTVFEASFEAFVCKQMVQKSNQNLSKSVPRRVPGGSGGVPKPPQESWTLLGPSWSAPGAQDPQRPSKIFFLPAPGPPLALQKIGLEGQISQKNVFENEFEKRGEINNDF